MSVSLVDVAKARSKSTALTPNVALGHFNDFLQYTNPDINLYSDLEKDDINMELLGKFADYLFRVRRVPKSSTSLTYCSVVRTNLINLKIGNQLKEKVSYHELGSAINSMHQHKAGESGELMADVADPITEKDLSVVCEVLFLGVETNVSAYQ